VCRPLTTSRRPGASPTCRSCRSTTTRRPRSPAAAPDGRRGQRGSSDVRPRIGPGAKGRLSAKCGGARSIGSDACPRTGKDCSPVRPRHTRPRRAARPTAAGGMKRRPSWGGGRRPRAPRPRRDLGRPGRVAAPGCPTGVTAAGGCPRRRSPRRAVASAWELVPTLPRRARPRFLAPMLRANGLPANAARRPLQVKFDGCSGRWTRSP